MSNGRRRLSKRSEAIKKRDVLKKKRQEDKLKTIDKNHQVKLSECNRQVLCSCCISELCGTAYPTLSLGQLDLATEQHIIAGQQEDILVLSRFHAWMYQTCELCTTFE